MSGLCSIIFGFVCYLLYKQKRNEIAWKWLGMFGIIKCLSKWTYVFIGIVKIKFFVSVLSITLSVISFLCLIEFARLYFAGKKNKFSLLVYPVIGILLYSSWYFGGQNWFEIFAGYILGVGSTILAGLVFWQNAGAIRENKKYFYCIAIMFFIFACTQLILPKEYFNSDIFLNFSWYSLQLLQNMLFLIVIFCLLLFYQTIINKELNKIQQKTKIIKLLLVMFASLCLLVGGLFLVDYLSVTAKNNIIKYQDLGMNILSDNFTLTFNGGKDLAHLLSNSHTFVNTLEKRDKDNFDATDVILDSCKLSSTVDVCYLLDKEGNTIASSNRFDPDSLVGKNYASRPYFINALSNDFGTYFAVGDNNKIGYYASHVLKNSKGEMVGVEVIKSNIDNLLRHSTSNGLAFLVNPDGVILLSDNPAYDLKILAPISSSDKKRLTETQQFGNSKFEPMFSAIPKSGDILEFNDKLFLAVVHKVEYDGWYILLLSPADSIVFYRFFGMLIILITIIIVIAVFLILQDIANNLFLSNFASFVNSSDDAIINKNLDSTIISWNHGAELIYGYTKNEIIGKNCLILWPEDRLEEHDKILSQIKLKKTIIHYKTFHVKKNRQIISVALTVIPVLDEFNNIAGVMMVSRDVSIEDEIKNKLKQQMLDLIKFKLAADGSSDAIFITDPEAVVLYANQAVEKMSGYKTTDIIGKYIGHLWGGHMTDSFYQNLWHVVKEEKKSFVSELKNLRKNGEEFVVEAKFFPILDEDGKVVFFVGVETDITKAKHVEQLKAEFVSITSHQLRTPLTGIKWFSELLLKGRAGKLSATQTDFIQQVAFSNERMIRLVDDLLDINHIDESGKYKIVLKSENFGKVIKESVGEFYGVVKNRKIKIKLDPNCLKKNILKIDKEKLTQAIQNILSNALNYSHDGGTVDINCEKTADHIICSISDHGIGIPQYQQDRVFEKFFRADNVITTGSGTGLCLYIAKFIVEGHGGKLSFKSKEGEGTTFYISLPIK